MTDTPVRLKSSDELERGLVGTELADGSEESTVGNGAVSPVNGLGDASTEASEAAVPWWKRKWVKVVVVRIIVRLSMIGLVIGLSFAFSFKSVVRKYSAWIHGFHPQISSVALYTTFATAFASIAPGSYAPIVLAGATYGIWIGWIIGYIAMNGGAALNLLWVRQGCKPAMKRCCARRLQRLQIDTIEFMLSEAPFRTVFLLRLPVVASGVLNYFFSLSDSLPARPYLWGNLLGNIPGTLLFSVLGTSVSSIGGAILNGNSDPKALAVGCVIVVIVISVIGAMAVLVRRALNRMKAQRLIAPSAAVIVAAATSSRETDVTSPHVEGALDAPSLAVADANATRSVFIAKYEDNSEAASVDV